MMEFGSVKRDWGHGAYAVPIPRATDTIGGALQRCFAPRPALPADMARLVDRLDRAYRAN